MHKIAAGARGYFPLHSCDGMRTDAATVRGYATVATSGHILRGDDGNLFRKPNQNSTGAALKPNIAGGWPVTEINHVLRLSRASISFRPTWSAASAHQRISNGDMPRLLFDSEYRRGIFPLVCLERLANAERRSAMCNALLEGQPRPTDTGAPIAWLNRWDGQLQHGFKT